MRKFNITLCCSLILILTACEKESGRAILPDNSVSIEFNSGKDTLEMPLSILKDTIMIFELNAELSGNASTSDHWVNFAVDTTKIIDYRDLYGEATLLPTSSYLFYKPMTRISAGASISEPAILNIVKQLSLKEYTTYVLPIVIQTVDGKVEGPAVERVVYYVFKTGKPLFINKNGWTIADFSSSFNNFLPANVLDANNTTTYWTSNITLQMPQWVTINFNRVITFEAVTYYLPTALGYPNLGGYPTSIQIETSMDGATWETSGIYEGNIVANSQTLNTGLTTARYLRFTGLAAVKYAATYECIFISGISLVP